jgi:predicted kinase
MADCVILIGLPAAGKSSFYRERFAATHDHISKDLLRNNRKPERRQAQLLVESLSGGRSLVVDNTNASAAARASLIEAARAHGARVIGYYFPTDAGAALRRNRARAGRDRVPDVAIFAVRKRMQPPSPEEGFDELFEVKLVEDEGRFEVVPWIGDRL